MRIIVAFPKLEDAKNLRNVLIRNGFDDTMAYNNAAQTIGAANDSDGGVLQAAGYALQRIVWLSSERIFDVACRQSFEIGRLYQLRYCLFVHAHP